jgi:hypothetical protein
MWTPILLSLLSLAQAEPHAVSITITNPAGVITTLEGSAPLETSEVLTMGSGSHRFDVRALPSGEDMKVIGELHEVRGKKDKVVRIATITLPAGGSSRAERISWGAPKGATVPDGLNPNLLAWRIEVEWAQPAPEAPPSESPVEGPPDEPTDTPADAPADAPTP